MLLYKKLRKGAALERTDVCNAGYDVFLTVPEDPSEQKSVYCGQDTSTWLPEETFHKIANGPWRITLPPGRRLALPTGIATAVFQNCALQVWPRSGWAYSFGVDTLAGLIDSGYRNEILIIVINHGSQAITFMQGDKIAQLVPVMLVPEHVLGFEEVTELPASERGMQGFGSSGNKKRKCKFHTEE